MPDMSDTLFVFSPVHITIPQGFFTCCRAVSSNLCKNTSGMSGMSAGIEI